MITALSDQLREAFPDVLVVDDLNQDSPFALFGFEVADGWYGILHHAFCQMQQRTVENQAVVRVRQVKEKYGTLRLYIQTNDDRCDEIADEAEESSETTCEVCGALGKLDTRGWLNVRCERHWGDGNISMSDTQIIALMNQLTNKH